jgi:hypothetical protein
MRTYTTREVSLPRRYLGEHIQSVRRPRKGYLLR